MADTQTPMTEFAKLATFLVKIVTDQTQMNVHLVLLEKFLTPELAVLLVPPNNT
jgi:hypothetical protein